MNSAIELQGLGWRPDRSFALRDVSLRVPVGAIYGFLGPNGSGKTTTIRMCMGMMKPDRGEIRVLGMAVPRDMSRILARVGYVPERPHVYPALTVAEQVRYHASFFHLWDAGWAKELTERLGLDPARKISRMSKGETGKLLLLLALSQRPDLLVLDEPTDGLDPVVRRDVLTAVLDYVGETGATVFISSHLVHELERICDWVGVMDDGALVAELPMQVFKNGIKRLKVADPPADPDPPFTILSRERANGSAPLETWVVRGWQDPMRDWFDTAGVSLRDVVDLDLEDGFVELLRSSRPKTPHRS
ncbi:MAG: ABC transporter ATP-binding protein [Gemmatimonadetes bacterium]|nr:ABC transporter ATP-binding protein [Gemmatimonadota bacterium]